MCVQKSTTLLDISLSLSRSFIPDGYAYQHKYTHFILHHPIWFEPLITRTETQRTIYTKGKRKIRNSVPLSLSSIQNRFDKFPINQILWVVDAVTHLFFVLLIFFLYWGKYIFPGAQIHTRWIWSIAFSLKRKLIAKWQSLLLLL